MFQTKFNKGRNMHIKIVNSYKSLITGKEVELPDFCVLTGKNGSGKSHFLEALSQRNISEIRIDETLVANTEVKYIGFNGLNPQINSACDQNTLYQITQECKEFLFNAQNRWKRVNVTADKHHWLLENRDQFAHNRNRSILFVTAIENILKKVKKDFDEISEDEFNFYIDILDLEEKDTFRGQFATIFKSYYIRYDENEYNKYENEKRHTGHVVLSDEEFVDMYGPKPWEFVNNILKDANLPYVVSDPEGSNRNSTFHFCLKNSENNIEIQPSDLSTGEKVLMSLALAIYNSSEDSIKNKVLLIDEPDAPLHPEFSKFLLATLKNHVVRKAGVKVIISTHSPTTVAMADEESIFEMDRDQKIPIKVTREQALSILTKGIPSLRVSIDKRRVVFVESQYDAENYEKIFELVSAFSSFETQLSFHASHNRSGTNCDDVFSLLGKLQFVDGTYGLVDFDNKNSSTNNVKVMGELGEKRYTIENYILDPIFIGLALIRDNLAHGPQNISYMGFASATHEMRQSLVDWILNELDFNGSKVNYATISGEIFSVDANWFTMKGHELEEKIKTKWGGINQIIASYRNKGDNALKCALLDKTIRDYPQFLSNDFVDLFRSFV